MNASNPKLRLAVMAVATVALGACATQPHTAARTTQVLSVDEILASAPQPNRESEPVTCLPRSAYTEVEVINPELLLFHGRGEQMWLNRMRRACVGLHFDRVLAFEVRNSRLCDLDTVRGIDTFGGSWSATGARCSLGTFDPVSPQQVELLKAEFSKRWRRL